MTPSCRSGQPTATASARRASSSSGPAAATASRTQAAGSTGRPRGADPGPRLAARRSSDPVASRSYASRHGVHVRGHGSDRPAHAIAGGCGKFSRSVSQPRTTRRRQERPLDVAGLAGSPARSVSTWSAADLGEVAGPPGGPAGVRARRAARPCAGRSPGGRPLPATEQSAVRPGGKLPGRLRAAT